MQKLCVCVCRYPNLPHPLLPLCYRPLPAMLYNADDVILWRLQGAEALTVHVFYVMDLAVISFHGFSYHCYSDITQLFLFLPQSDTQGPTHILFPV